jgi:alpha,alpha-trehalase
MNNNLKYRFILILLVSFIFTNVFGQINPQEKLGALFQDVQRSKIFKDQKRFVDCEPKASADEILSAWKAQKNAPAFNLKNFVAQYFDTIQTDTVAMLRHINYLWSDLTRQADVQRPFSSLLALPNSYIVPGGRFLEIYYWDSYFTMLGLQESGKVDMIENMIDNFAYLIKTYGHIPNGNRAYYLSRSQPPFFALMVALLAEAKKDEAVYTHYLPAMEQEYRYWMTGNKVVRIGKQDVLNRYWDADNTPRPEAYLHDEVLFLKANRDSSIFRDLRSSAESGWDFSTRWFGDGHSLATIQTTQLVPVDLNCLLYNLELTLAKAYRISNNAEKALSYENLAQKRKKAIFQYCWNEEKGFFFDYNIKTGKQSDQYTLAGLYPLYLNLATTEQAEKVKLETEKDFLKPGGLVTTLAEGSGQQWDSPNAWAPLLWVSYKGLQNYQYNALAQTIAQRWTKLNVKVYFATGKMMEKYNVVDINKPGGGGEYDTQDGFGWTNGVFLKMWKELHNKSK